MAGLTPLDTTWLLFGAFLVMSMQIGFCLLETGLTRRADGIDVGFRNLVDFTVAALVYWALGYGLMYGASVNGWFGSDGWLVANRDTNAAFLLFQLTVAGVAATIVGGALAERTRLLGHTVVAALAAGVVYPVAGHWAWGGAPEGAPSGWLGQLGFIDFAGGTVVHGTGGWLALAGVLVVGPRLGRFAPAPDGTRPGPSRGGDRATATIGVLVLWFGWFGFIGASAVGRAADVGAVVVNTMLAGAAGGLTLVLLAFVRDARPDVAACINGTLAGLVAVTAGAQLYETTDAILVGVAGATVASLGARTLERLRIDDAIGAFPVHACAGLAGTLLVAVFGDPAAFGDRSALEQLGVQALGAGSIALWAFGVGYVVLFALNAMLPLRVSARNGRTGLDVAGHDAFGEIGEREEALRRSRSAAEFRFILERSHEGIVELALDGGALQADPAAARALGFADAADLVAHAGRFLDGVDWHDGAAHRRLTDRLATRGLVQGVELDFHRPVDGRAGRVEIAIRRLEGDPDVDDDLDARPERASDGTARPVAWLASLADVSGQRADAWPSLGADEEDRAASRAKSDSLAASSPT